MGGLNCCKVEALTWHIVFKSAFIAPIVAQEFRSLFVTGCVQVVPLKELTLSELKQHDGSEPGKPMYLAIRGTVFDVTIGKYAFICPRCLQAYTFQVNIFQLHEACFTDVNDLKYYVVHIKLLCDIRVVKHVT